jgi:predicted secreted protein
MATTFTKTAHGSTIKINVNEMLILELAENPTTGYRWQIMLNEGIEIISSDFMLNTTIAVGGGGMRSFTMKVAAPGTFHLSVKLRHPWEEENIFIEHFEMDILAE